MSTDLRIERLTKEFESHDGGGAVVAVNDVSLQVEQGTLVTLLGPSGCGKTTLLRMIAGFEEPTSGQIFFGDREVQRLAPNRRDTAMVFQSYAIFPHLNVFENVAFGLKMRQLRPAEIRKRVEAVLALVGLEKFSARQPSQLSGGQQQRVALARAMVVEPRLLLFDEPLSNLDAKLREQMRDELRELQTRLGVTSIYVTHDQVEAMAISDLVVVLNGGRLEQQGSPTEIYTRPRNRFVADFIGRANFLPVDIIDASHARTAGGIVPVIEAPHVVPGRQGTLMVRPENIEIHDLETADGAGTSLLPGRVARSTFLGSHAEYRVTVEGVGEIQIDQANPVADGLFSPGMAVGLAVGRSYVLPSETA